MTAGGLAGADRLLAEWQARIATIQRHLVDLAMDQTFEAMEAGEVAGWPDYAGVTRDRVREAFDAYQELVGHFVRLNEVVARAAAERAAWNGLWGGDEVAGRIRALLEGPSIELAAVRTPLAQRALLGVATTEHRVTPAQLTAAMETAFATVRDLVVAIDAAQERIAAQTGAADAVAAEVLSAAAAVSLDTGEVAALRAALADLRARGASDPLGTAPLLADLLPRLEGARRQVEAARQARAAALAARERAGATLAHLGAEGEAAPIAHPGRAALPAAVQATAAYRAALAALRADLTTWLAEIDERLTTGRWEGAAVGLARWQEAATARRRQARAALERAIGPLLAADDLDGRIAARQRQVQSYLRAGRTIDPAVADALRAAEAALAGDDPAIDLARARLEAAEARLREAR